MRLHECICTPTHACIYMYMHTYTQTHTHTYTYIYTCTCTRIHAHTYTHACTYHGLYTDSKSQQQRLNASNNIIDAHTHPYTYACIYTHIWIYTYVQNLQRMCHRCVRWCQRNICIMHTTAHALVLRTPVLKCTQHSLQIWLFVCKKLHIYIYTHTYAYAYISTRIHMHICMTPSKHAKERLLTWRLKIYGQIFIHIHIHVYIHACFNLYIYTCRYIHICLFVHTHTYTYIRTHIQHVLTRTQISLERRRCRDCVRSLTWCHESSAIFLSER